MTIIHPTNIDITALEKGKFPRLQRLGEFEIVSGDVIVSDPCYEPDAWCTLTLRQVQTGTWRGSVILKKEQDWGVRPAALIASHTSLKGKSQKTLKFQQEDADIGVDSGQAGIFDLHNGFRSSLPENYVWGPNPRQNSTSPMADRLIADWEKMRQQSPWYTMCCETTNPAGVIPGGAVSESGYGDGSYRCYTAKNPEGDINAIVIVFMSLRSNTLNPLIQESATK